MGVLYEIPVSTDSLYTQRTTLDGSDYLFTFALNSRDGCWYIDIADADGVAIAVSLRVVCNRDLLKRCLDARRPPGRLEAIDLSGAGLDPGATDFGTRVVLLYRAAT